MNAFGNGQSYLSHSYLLFGSDGRLLGNGDITSVCFPSLIPPSELLSFKTLMRYSKTLRPVVIAA